MTPLRRCSRKECGAARFCRVIREFASPSSTPLSLSKIAALQESAAIKSRRFRTRPVKLTVVFLIMSLFSFFFGCSRSSPSPAGYDWMLERNGGNQPDRSDIPGSVVSKEVQLGSQWVNRWQSSLTFFTAELSSPEPRRIKTSMVCLADLAMTTPLLW